MNYFRPIGMVKISELTNSVEMLENCAQGNDVEADHEQRIPHIMITDSDHITSLPSPPYNEPTRTYADMEDEEKYRRICQADLYANQDIIVKMSKLKAEHDRRVSMFSSGYGDTNFPSQNFKKDCRIWLHKRSDNKWHFLKAVNLRAYNIKRMDNIENYDIPCKKDCRYWLHKSSDKKKKKALLDDSFGKTNEKRALNKHFTHTDTFNHYSPIDAITKAGAKNIRERQFSDANDAMDVSCIRQTKRPRNNATSCPCNYCTTRNVSNAADLPLHGVFGSDDSSLSDYEVIQTMDGVDSLTTTPEHGFGTSPNHPATQDYVIDSYVDQLLDTEVI